MTNLFITAGLPIITGAAEATANNDTPQLNMLHMQDANGNELSALKFNDGQGNELSIIDMQTNGRGDSFNAKPFGSSDPASNLNDFNRVFDNFKKLLDPKSDKAKDNKKEQQQEKMKKLGFLLGLMMLLGLLNIPGFNTSSLLNGNNS